MKRFPWQLFARVVLIQSVLVLVAVGGSALTARHFFKRQFTAQAGNQLREMLSALEADLPPPGAALAPGWCEERARRGSLRLAVLGRDGRALCESHPGAGEGGARAGDEELLFVSLDSPGRGWILRAGLPLSTLGSSLRLMDASIAAMLLALAATLGVFAVWSSKMLVFPIGRLLLKTKGALEEGSTLPSRDAFREETFGEWSELESSIDDIRRDLRAKAESLSVEREELATLMGAISDAILAVDAEGRPLFFNSRFALLFGDRGDREALSDRSVRLWEMFRVPEILEAYKKALEQGRAGEAKAVSIEREGQAKRFFSVSVSPLRKGPGAPYGAVGIFHDVTELKSAEQIRIDFVANVSHELRTPLTSIKGYADTLLIDAREGRPPSREFLDIIGRNVDRLMSLIRDLLDLSSLESADVLHKIPVDAAEITDRVIGQLRGAFAAKGQAVEREIGVALVMADPARLEQVMVNLLENASKYTPAGGRISVRWEEEGGDSLLRVSDNGPGIPPEHHARLFERFYRVDKARSRDQGGTGLGLAIVKHILQRHDGAVWVESSPGRGASFICRFPR